MVGAKGELVKYFKLLPLSGSGAIITSVVYGDLEITSGAIQYGVPTKDFRFGTSLLICAQKPKSESFTYTKESKVTLNILH